MYLRFNNRARKLSKLFDNVLDWITIAFKTATNQLLGNSIELSANDNLMSITCLKFNNKKRKFCIPC